MRAYYQQLPKESDPPSPVPAYVKARLVKSAYARKQAMDELLAEFDGLAHLLSKSRCNIKTKSSISPPNQRPSICKCSQMERSFQRLCPWPQSKRTVSTKKEKRNKFVGGRKLLRFLVQLRQMADQVPLRQEHQVVLVFKLLRSRILKISWCGSQTQTSCLSLAP